MHVVQACWSRIKTKDQRRNATLDHSKSTVTLCRCMTRDKTTQGNIRSSELESNQPPPGWYVYVTLEDSKIMYPGDLPLSYWRTVVNNGTSQRAVEVALTRSAESAEHVYEVAHSRHCGWKLTGHAIVRKLVYSRTKRAFRFTYRQRRETRSEKRETRETAETVRRNGMGDDGRVDGLEEHEADGSDGRGAEDGIAGGVGSLEGED